MYMKRLIHALIVIILILALSTAYAEGFLVSENAPAQSGSTWTKLFGKPESDTAAGDIRKADDYAAHLEELYKGSIIDAVNGFARLGKYRESVKLTDYCYAQLSYMRNDMRKARKGFEALGAFGDAEYRVKLCDAMSAHRIYIEGKFGYADLGGSIVIAPAFDWAERVFRDESRVPEEDSREESLLPVAAVFNGTVASENGDLIPVEGKYGLIRRDGELIAPIIYDKVLWTNDGLAALSTNGHIDLISTITGKTLGSYDDVREYSQSFIPVSLGGKWGYVDKLGEYLYGGFQWDDALPFSEGYAAVMLGDSYGFIDLSGAVAIEPQYQDVRGFGEGLAAVRINKRWSFINEANEIVIDREYQDAGVFSQGACPVKKGGKYGLIDRENNAITSFKYAEFLPFDPVYHRAWVRTNKLWGLAAPSGEIISKPEWSEITPFGANGLSRVGYKGKYSYIDINGVTLIESSCSLAAPFSAGHGGIVNEQGQVEYLDRFSHGFTVDGEFPTEALCGFIEARKTAPANTADAVSGESGKTPLMFRLYEVDGTPITDWTE